MGRIYLAQATRSAFAVRFTDFLAYDLTFVSNCILSINAH